MPEKHPDHDLRAVGTFATVADVAARWGQTPSDAEAALIDIRLADVERMIERKIPTLRADVVAGRIAKADVVQVEAEVVLRLMRNPEGFIAETDGDYSYQRARELSTGRLNILDEEFEALGFRRSRMSILVPEPMVEEWSDTASAAAAVAAAVEYIVANEAALLKKPATTIAVTRDTAQLWMFDPTSRKANPNGWVPVGDAAQQIVDGLQQGQLLYWDARLRKWTPNPDSTASGDGYTLVWSNAKSSWTVSANRLQDLTDVDAAARKSGGLPQTGDLLTFDEPSKRWVVSAPSDFVTKLALGTLAAGDIVVFDGTHWVNTAGYTKADVDQKLSNVVSGLARKPAVQDVTDTPPVAPVIGQNFIVGKSPAGGWVGHANEVTFWDGSNWIFEPPLKGDTHTNLASNQALTWNGTEWVSIGSQASALKDLSGVALTIPATDQVLTFDGTNWVNKKIPDPPANLLDDLVDVDTAGVSGGDVLTYDDTTAEWVPTAPPAGTLATLKDVAVPSPTTGDVLMYDTVSKAWVGKAPNLVTSPLDGLVDVDATDPDNGDMLVFDDASKTWINTKALTVDELELPGGLVEQLVEDTDDAFDDATAVPNVAALKKFVAAEKADIRLEELLDCTELATAADGQVPVWSDTNDRWEPKTLTSPIIFLGTGAWVAADVADPAKRYGMAADTAPDPTVWAPQPGDQYIDLATGNVTVFTGTAAPAPPDRTVSGIVGGASPTDLVPTPALADLSDVDFSVPPTDGQLLRFNGATSNWAPTPPPALSELGGVTFGTGTSAPKAGDALVFGGTDWTPTSITAASISAYTKAELDAKLGQLALGMAHGESVNAIANTPPPAPTSGALYIVGTAGTGAWLGQNNNLALWTGTAWEFSPPETGESHLVEDVSETWHWSGAAWVKVASTAATVSGSTAAHGVGEIIPWIAATVPADYLPCNGQVVAISAYQELHNVIGDAFNAATSADGTTTFALPDLRGYFLRGIGSRGGEARVGIVQEDTTRLPRTAFTGTTADAGAHAHGNGAGGPQINSDGGPNWKSGYDRGVTATDGIHRHMFTVTAGGDTETRPKSVAVNWIIRVRAINGGAKGEKGEKGDAAAVGDMWTVGSIQQSTLDETQFRTALGLNSSEDHKWVLADGRNVAGTKYAQITGRTTVPDLRGAFLRMAGTNAGNTSWVGGALNGWQEDSTRMPRTAFTATLSTEGNHRHASGAAAWGENASNWYGLKTEVTSKRLANYDGDTYSTPFTNYDGSHTHTATVAGGDTETRPKNYSVNYFIKVN